MSEEREVVAEISISEGQSLEKIYRNCRPMRLDDGPGKYEIVKVDSDDE